MSAPKAQNWVSSDDTRSFYFVHFNALSRARDFVPSPPKQPQHISAGNKLKKYMKSLLFEASSGRLIWNSSSFFFHLSQPLRIGSCFFFVTMLFKLGTGNGAKKSITYRRTTLSRVWIGFAVRNKGEVNQQRANFCWVLDRIQHSKTRPESASSPKLCAQSAYEMEFRVVCFQGWISSSCIFFGEGSHAAFNQERRIFQSSELFSLYVGRGWVIGWEIFHYQHCVESKDRRVSENCVWRHATTEF